MSYPHLRGALAGAVVAAALGALAEPVGAAPYRGTFDPVDFRGEYLINTSADCLAQENGWYANSGDCSATLLSVYADVLDSSSADPPANEFDGRLWFVQPPVSNSLNLFGLYIVDHQIDSFDTALIHHLPSSDPTTADWWIQFVSGQMPPPCCIDIAQFDTSTKGVNLYANNQDDLVGSAQYEGPAQDLAIPEPGTLSLLLGALGGGWLARRRRKEKDSS